MYKTPQEYEKEIAALREKIYLLENSPKENIDEKESPSEFLSLISRVNSLPPPPPPPPSLKRTQSQAAGYKPLKKLRGLFWTKVPKPLKIPSENAIDHRLVWDEIFHLPKWNFDREQRSIFEEEYCIKPKVVEVQKLQKKNDDVIAVYDQKKSTQIGIIISNLPQNFIEIIEKFEYEKLNEEQIEGLITIYPPPDIIEHIENLISANSKSKLGKCEEFALSISQLPYSLEKLKVWKFSKLFDEMFNKIFSMICDIQAGLYELKLCQEIPKILSYCLLVGNFMNYGTNRGDAYGFSYSFLENFAQCKNNKKTSTLHNFIVEKLLTNSGENFDIENGSKLNSANLPYFPILQRVSKIPLSEVKQQADCFERDYIMNLKTCEYMTKMGEITIQKIHNELEEKGIFIHSLKEKVNSCVENFDEMTSWLGEPVGKVIDSSEFFQTWCTFLEPFYEK